MDGFISYAHDDYRQFRELQSHLKAIERELGVCFWADHRIRAGYDWTVAIEKAVESASIFLLLLTPKYIESDFIYEKELPAIQLRRSKGALVVPIVLKRCAWQMIAGVLQAVPMIDGHVKPINDWRPHDHGFNCTRDEIGTAIKGYFGLTTKPIFGSLP
jgi:TIR domain